MRWALQHNIKAELTVTKCSNFNCAGDIYAVQYKHTQPHYTTKQAAPPDQKKRLDRVAATCKSRAALTI
jgi:hypothetical protein